MTQKAGTPLIQMSWQGSQQVFDLLVAQQKAVSSAIEAKANQLSKTGEDAADAAFLAGLMQEHLKELCEIVRVYDHMFLTPDQSNIDWDRALLVDYGE